MSKIVGAVSSLTERMFSTGFSDLLKTPILMRLGLKFVELANGCGEVRSSIVKADIDGMPTRGWGNRPSAYLRPLSTMDQDLRRDEGSGSGRATVVKACITDGDQNQREHYPRCDPRLESTGPI